MEGQDEPKCETCDNYEPYEGQHRGTCWKDGMKVDEKESCWWHSAKNHKEPNKQKGPS